MSIHANLLEVAVVYKLESQQWAMTHDVGLKNITCMHAEV